ncbi:MAG: LLM class flavin-dependent oxidoreductase [Mycetocola reblochoni]|uniref:Nitrilotriacetate monooxygenase component A n=2 Tax=Mycetocola reblochoni TaxID=331618 RepID=A0A1R4IUX1_9MICO|nr:LLM class flavin-dependent oxidoreductase [Mycetocola reblochoni]RLP71010.1 LLM class flavin-dependent oxidoreductase [Mycetocola reblochoni]SJN23676.1 Nitrilotriacetate monooxygenase component A [Mycetocola reblochoni REB411]
MNAAGTRLALGLRGALVLAILDDAPSLSRIAGPDVSFVVAGIDRIEGSARGDADATVLATALAAETPVPVLAAGSVQHDHPYNLARRVASLDQLSEGRSGLLLARRDSGDDPSDAWAGAALGVSAPADGATAADAAAAIAALWHSWPVSSIVGDRASGVYTQAHRIHRLAEPGIFGVAGPLNVPTTPQGVPVLAYSLADDEDAAPSHAELVVSRTAPDGRSAGDGTVWWQRLRVESVDDVDGLLLDGDADGVFLVLDTDDVTVALTALDRARSVWRVSAPRAERTLRDALALRTPAAPAAGPAAFRAPVPLH